MQTLIRIDVEMNFLSGKYMKNFDCAGWIFLTRMNFIIELYKYYMKILLGELNQIFIEIFLKEHHYFIQFNFLVEPSLELTLLIIFRSAKLT